MCVANSARSQLAEGLAKHLLPAADIRSAGTHPTKLNPFAVHTMTEIGIDISDQYSKSVTELPPQFIMELDYVITLCAEEVCPAILTHKAKRLHWPLPDPASNSGSSADDSLRRFRQTRDSIKARIEELKMEIAE